MTTPGKQTRAGTQPGRTLPAAGSPGGAGIWSGPFSLAFGAHLLLAISFFALVLFPLYVQDLQGDTFTIGLLAATALACGILLRWVMAPVWDRLPRRLLFVLGGLLNVGGLALLIGIPAVGVRLFVARGLQGAGTGLLFGAFFAYANAQLHPARRSEGLGIFGISGMAGSYLGVWIGELVLARGGFGVLFGTMAAVGALSLLLTLCLPAAPRRAELLAPQAPTDAGATIGGRTRLWLLCILFGAATAALHVFLAPLAAERGLRPVWPFFLTYSAAAIALRLGAGSLPDRFGHRRILWPALFSLGAGLLLLPMAADVRGLLPAGLLCGLAHGYIFPTLGAMAVARAGTQGAGGQVGLFTSFVDMGGLLGGPFLGLVALRSGTGSLFWVAGCLVLCLSALVLGADTLAARPPGKRGEGSPIAPDRGQPS